MHWLNAIPLQPFLVFTLVLARVSGLVLTAPVYGTSETPPRVRALLAFALALLVMPSQWNAGGHMPATLVDLLIVLVGELMIGLTLGLGVLILFSGMQLAGQVISQVSGMSLADVFDPTLDESVPLFSELLRMFTLAIFLGIGGHRMVMAGLLDTFAALPPGQAGMSDSLAGCLSALVSESFALGVRASAPVATALLLAALVLGLIGRTLPQLNIMALGFGLNVLVTLFTVALSLTAIAWLFQDQVEPFLGQLIEGVTTRK
jgi:flagellar biosynthetic protein FliR